MPVFPLVPQTFSSGHLLRLKFGVIVTGMEVAGASRAFPKPRASHWIGPTPAEIETGPGWCEPASLPQVGRCTKEISIKKKRNALKRMNRNPMLSVDGCICSDETYMEHFSMAFQFRLLLAAAMCHLTRNAEKCWRFD
jgi:hypothetical protein